MSVERTEVERLLCRQVKVEKTGVSVTVRDAVHAHANHYIKESRPYFREQQLKTYIDCPYLLNIARGMCVASLFGALVAVGGSIALPIFFFIACLLFFCVYCQHEWVNQKSLPVVLKQPVFDQSRQSSANEFYEVLNCDWTWRSCPSELPGWDWLRDVVSRKNKIPGLQWNSDPPHVRRKRPVTIDADSLLNGRCLQLLLHGGLLQNMSH